MDHYYQTIYSKENLFKISAVFCEHFLNLTVFQNETAWKVNIPKEELTQQSKDREYYDNLKMYFRLCPQDVEFNFMNGQLTINLFLENKMKILVFTSNLKQVDFVENLFYLVDKFYSDKTQYYEELNGLEKQNKSLQKDKINFNEQINVFLERKKAEELKHYNRFVVLLNEKKRHIQHLSDLLIAVRKEKQLVNSSINNKGKNIDQSKKNVLTKNLTNIKTVSESDDTSSLSDNDYNMNNEKEDSSKEASNISHIPTSKTNSPSPSTSLSRTSFIVDSPTTLCTFSKRNRTDNLSVDLPEKIRLELNQTKTKINVDSNIANNESKPTVNFSTQDLLDNL